nr:hypothetical protein Iba_chr03aCG21970 [Ipomoea batatas]
MIYVPKANYCVGPHSADKCQKEWRPKRRIKLKKLARKAKKLCHGRGEIRGGEPERSRNESCHDRGENRCEEREPDTISTTIVEESTVEYIVLESLARSNPRSRSWSDPSIIMKWISNLD